MERQTPEQPNYYGTGRRPKENKPQLSLILALMALVLAVNLVTVVIHRASREQADDPKTEQDELSGLPIASLPSDGLIKDEGVSFGMQVCELDDTQRRYWDLPEGVMILEVAEGGSADLAGLQRGDVIVSVNACSVTDAESYQTAVGQCAVGDAVPISVYRDGVYYDFEVTLPE